MLSVLLCNARSVVNKTDDLALLIDHYGAKIILVTETWLHADIPDSFLGLCSHFHLFRKDRMNRKGGGVCALVSNELNVCTVQIPLHFFHLEMLCFDLVDCNSKYRFIICYRPPGYNESAQSYAKDLADSLQGLASVSYTVFICGDINLPYANWESFSSPQDHVHLPFYEFLQSYGFSQYVSEPTRDMNILDVVFCNDPLIISDCYVEPPLTGSDHNIVGFDFLLPSHISDSLTDDVTDNLQYDFNNADYNGLCSFLCGCDWYSLVTDSLDVDLLWNRFTEVLNFGISMFVPTVRYSAKRKPRYPKHIRRLFHKKCTLWHALKKYGRSSIRKRYQSISLACKKAVNEFVHNKEASLIVDGYVKGPRLSGTIF